MGQWSTGQWSAAGRILIGAALLTIAPMLTEAADAKSRPPQTSHSQASKSRSGRTQIASSQSRRTQVNATRVSFQSRSKYTLKGGKARYAARGGPRLQCVSFARATSGIELKGNAANWWDAAAGIYERGNRPEPGSVLNFRSIGRMRLGHVAVVTAVAGSREIEIEHANWAGPGANKGAVSRNVPVIDVSENNDWSAVRVGLGRSGDYGSVYPTYGFIYDRADRGVMVANGPSSGFNPTVMAVDEVAEAAPRRTRTKPIYLNQGSDAPTRTLR